MILEQKQAFLEQLILEHKQGATSLFRQKAFDHFLEIGLPDKKTPTYEYFPVARLYENKDLSSPVKMTKSEILEKVLPECIGSYLVLENGIINLDLSDTSRLPKGIIIENLENSQSPYMPFVNAKLIQRQKLELDPFSLYCQASMKGILVVMPDATPVEVPLQIITVFDGSKILSSTNIYVHVGKNVTLEMIHTHICFNKCQATTFIDVDVDQASSCEITRINSDLETMMFDAMRVHLKKDASVKVFDFNIPCVPSKFHLHVMHHQKQSKSILYALSMICSKHEYHISTNFEHIAGEAESSQHVKTVLCSKAKASFEGQIHVHKEALLTQSYQKHATLMLGDYGIINSKPNLRIFADDVKASHGATIAELDADSLFYLKSRGIDEQSARALLLEGFCLEMMQEVRLDSIKEEANNFVKRLQTT